MIKLNLASKPPVGISAAKLQTAARLTYKQTGFNLSGEVGLRFLNKARSRELNRTYANQDYATDVLSFDYETLHRPAAKRHILPLGDIVICTGIARRQAREHQVSFEAEVLLLTVHGLLHVLGFDHNSATGRAGFANLQNAIMELMKQPAREYFHGDNQ